MKTQSKQKGMETMRVWTRASVLALAAVLVLGGCRRVDEDLPFEFEAPKAGTYTMKKMVWAAFEEPLLGVESVLINEWDEKSYNVEVEVEGDDLLLKLPTAGPHGNTLRLTAAATQEEGRQAGRAYNVVLDTAFDIGGSTMDEDYYQITDQSERMKEYEDRLPPEGHKYYGLPFVGVRFDWVLDKKMTVSEAANHLQFEPNGNMYPARFTTMRGVLEITLALPEGQSGKLLEIVKILNTDGKIKTYRDTSIEPNRFNLSPRSHLRFVLEFKG